MLCTREEREIYVDYIYIYAYKKTIKEKQENKKIRTRPRK